MKQRQLFLLWAFPVLAMTCWASAAENAPAQAPPTIASEVDREVSNVEKEVVETAEAMPEDRFNFSPESLNLPGSDYKGVRTFAEQVKHIAASNFATWSPLTGDVFPNDYLGGAPLGGVGSCAPCTGPAAIKTKAEIMKFLKGSFALGHKAAASLTAANMLEPVGKGKSARPRLHLAFFGVEHAFDNYGQMVEYLRMNGIVPPASRGQ